jgi:type IV pilus assembly protein PilW
MKSKQTGFTLLEILISLSVGIVLVGGVMSAFVGMKTTSAETSAIGELQENGRFALNILTDDLLRQDFWGDYTGTFDLASLAVSPDADSLSNDCNGEGINNSTFPRATGHFRTLWGETAATSSVMDCIDDAKIGSDVMQLKRVISSPVTTTTANNYYLATNMNSGVVFTGTDIPDVDNSQVWEYQHHVYYVKEETVSGVTFPVLMQGRLTTDMTFGPIIDGVEMIRFMYGVDTTGDGIINAYISADNVTEDQWDNANDINILAVRIFVLTRAVHRDFDYSNTNTYLLGDLEVTMDDNYRRLLLSTTVTLYNSGVDSW